MRAFTMPRVRVVLVLVVALAAASTVAGVPLTSAQGPTVFVAGVEDGLPVDDPFAETWDRAAAVEVPLSGQAVAHPMLVDPTVASVRVRALTDGERMAVLVEWEDASRDDSVLRSDAFADAVAMQLARGQGFSICMGQQAGAVNIWHWKADWAADMVRWRDVGDVNPNMPVDPGASGPSSLVAGRDAGNLRSATMRPSSVEETDAVGFGSLTSQPVEGQSVRGASAHHDGSWRVVMSRTLVNDDPNDAQFAAGASVAVAFAVWDGSNGDRDGLKSTSSWQSLALVATPVGFLDAWPFLVLIAVAIGLATWMLYVGLRQPAIGLGWPPGGPRPAPGRPPRAAGPPLGPDPSRPPGWTPPTAGP
jgi:hypothetical protein